MKKLITLTVVLLFSTAAAFAQSSEATIDQAGVATNDVYLTQSSGAVANIDQNSGSSSAVSGSNNLLRGIGQLDAYSNASTLEIIQGFSGSFSNEVRVMQYGNDHYFKADQEQNGFAKVEQRGNDNSVGLRQNGDNTYTPEADIFQSSRDNAVTLVQLNSDSYADIDQTGRSNKVVGTSTTRAFQENGPNELNLLQSGNNNTLQLDQNGVDNSNPANVINLDQLSNGNMASITQNGGSNNVNLTQ